MKRKANYILDFRETITSFALLKMTQVLKTMKTRQVLEVITNDLDARTDVLRVVPSSPCQVIGMEVNEQTGLCRIQMEKM
jgi:TusA-related sulfurtransferase